MKTAIPVPGLLPGYRSLQPNPDFEALKATFEANSSYSMKPAHWFYGNVDSSCQIPSWVTEGFSDALERLNTSSKAKFKFAADLDSHTPGFISTRPIGKTEYGRTLRYETSPQLLFGRGSIGPHTDGVAGLCLLTLLGGFAIDKEDSPDYHETDGVFYQRKMVELRPGESVVFDDRETHAWLHNACWIFSSVPLIKMSTR